MKILSFIATLVLLATGLSPGWACAQAVSADPESGSVAGAAQSAASQNTQGQAEPGVTLGASIDTDALSKFSGNASVNIAAGAPNLQPNQTALVTAAQTGADTGQDATTMVRMTGSENVMLGARPLGSASADTGINIPASTGNLQVSVLVMH